MYNSLMKKSVDLLLILPLLLAIVLIVFASQTGTLTEFFGAGIAVPIGSGTLSVAPSVLPSTTSLSTSTTPPVGASTSTPLPSSSSTQANTQSPTPTPTTPPTETAIPTTTETPVSQEIEGGIATGNEIVLAIEHYYLDHGYYPAALDDLLPAYLSSIPITSMGQTYFYRFFDGAHPMAAEGYWLSFRVSEQENLTCTYLRRLEYWDCNYASP